MAVAVQSKALQHTAKQNALRRKQQPLDKRNCNLSKAAESGQTFLTSCFFFIHWKICGSS